RVGLAEAEPAEPPQRLVRLQAAIRRRPEGTPAAPAPRACARTRRALPRRASPRSAAGSRATAPAAGARARASGHDGELLDDADALLAPRRRDPLRDLGDRPRRRGLRIRSDERLARVTLLPQPRV